MNVGDRVKVQETGAFVLPPQWKGRSGTIKQHSRETGECVVALDSTPARRAEAALIPPGALVPMVEGRQARSLDGPGVRLGVPNKLTA